MKPIYKVGDLIVPNLETEYHTIGVGVVLAVFPEEERYLINWDGYCTRRSEFYTLHKYYKLATPLEQVLR